MKRGLGGFLNSNARGMYTGPFYRGLGQGVLAGAAVGGDTGSAAVSTAQSQDAAAKASGGAATEVTGPLITSSPTPTDSGTAGNAALIAGQNANKVNTISTTSTNAILWGIGALAVGGVVAVALVKGRRRRRRR